MLIGYSGLPHFALKILLCAWFLEEALDVQLSQEVIEELTHHFLVTATLERFGVSASSRLLGNHFSCVLWMFWDLCYFQNG